MKGEWQPKVDIHIIADGNYSHVMPKMDIETLRFSYLGQERI
jgi:hypothetical protein